MKCEHCGRTQPEEVLKEALDLLREMPSFGDEHGMMGYEEDYTNKVSAFLKRHGPQE